MLLRTHLWIACKAGALVGLVLGHIDLLSRLVMERYEWFEVYLSLLTPTVIIAVFCGLTAFGIHLIVRLLGKESLLQRAQVERAYFTFALLAVVLMVTLVSVLYALYGDVLLWSPERFSTNSAVFFLIILFALLIQRNGQRLIDALLFFFQRKWVREVWVDYLLVLFVFSLTALLMDVYRLYRLPDQMPLISLEKKSTRPNVILITLDTVRSDHLGLYGYPKRTSPYLDTLAEQSVVFDEVNSVSSWTLPAHASLFTGKYIYQHQAHETHQMLEPDQETLAEIFHKEGYRTAGFIAGPYCKGKYGLSQGFQVYHDRLDFFEYRHTYDTLSMRRFLDFFSNSLRALVLQNDGERTAPELNRSIFRWINRVEDEPFFLFLNYFDAHDPYTLGEEYRHLFTNEKRDDEAINEMIRSYYFDASGRFRVRNIDDSLREYLLALYDSEIAYLDGHLRTFMKTLEERGHLDNTIVIITSDHGEEFFEHGGVMHKQTLYQEVLRVPLLIYYPKMLQPSRVSHRVSLVDIFPTLLDLVELPEQQGIDGVSLLPLITEQEIPKRNYVLSQRYARAEHGESRQDALTGQEWKFIQVNPERERIPTALFNLKVDPQEQDNQIQELSEQREEMKLHLQEITTD